MIKPKAFGEKVDRRGDHEGPGPRKGGSFVAEGTGLPQTPSIHRPYQGASDGSIDRHVSSHPV